DGDQEINSVLLCAGQPLVHVPRRWVLFDAVENENLQRRAAQRLKSALWVTSRLETGIGDQEYARAAELTHELTQLGKRTGTEYQARERLVIERRQRPARAAGTDGLG